MSAIIKWFASALQSADGTGTSSTRIVMMMFAIAFVVGCFVRLPAATLSLILGGAFGFGGIRDGGPFDSYFQSKVAVAASAPGATPVAPLPTSAP